MQVLTPQDFSRIIFSATASPQSTSFNPNKHFKSPNFQPVSIPPVFQNPNPVHQTAPKSFYSEIGSSIALNHVDEVKNQVAFLESEVQRMTDELRMKVDSSKRERQARDKLTRENESLRSDVAKMKSLLHSRDQQIQELERQLSSSHNQLSLLKRRYMAAVEEAKHSIPGTIKNIQKEQRSMGVQVDEINGLEERIYKLTVALKEERSRNKRVKSIISTDNYYENASVPPVPRVPNMRTRGTSVQPVSSRDRRSTSSKNFIMETIPLAYIHKRKTRLTHSHFMVINCRSIAAPPPQDDLSGISAIHHFQPTVVPTSKARMSAVSPISPIYRQWNPLRENPSSFEVFQDKDLLSLSPPPLPLTTSANSGGLRDMNLVQQTKQRTAKPAKSSSSYSQYDISSPPPPRSNHSSEDAIKRAVAAAVEKRKQLASMGMSVGSKTTSSISSFMSDYGKPRFGCFLG